MLGLHLSVVLFPFKVKVQELEVGCRHPFELTSSAKLSGTTLGSAQQVNFFACTHTFKIDKARRQLGYTPKKYTFADCVDHYLKDRPRRRNFFLMKCFLGFLILIGLVLLTLYSQDIYPFFQEMWQRYGYLLERIPIMQRLFTP